MTPKEHIKMWCEEQGFEIDDDSLEKALRENAFTNELNIDHRRHWYTYDKVADIGGRLIMYKYANTTTDWSAKRLATNLIGILFILSKKWSELWLITK